jgi:hypothetical protein
LVSPIFRQEVYAGQPIKTYLIDVNGVQELEEELPINYSPVNFFRPDELQHPNFSDELGDDILYEMI